MSNSITKRIAVSAVCVALAFVTSNIKLFQMPLGGSVTLLSMLFICLVGYFYGFRTGIVVGILYGLLQLIIKPEFYTIWQVLVDYPLAFGALGLAGIGFHLEKKFKYGSVMIAYLLGVFGRYVFAFISGWIFFGSYAPKGWNPFIYSLAYNGAYIGAEAAITLVILALPPVQEALKSVKKQIS